MKKRTLLDQLNEDKELIKSYSNYLPECKTIAQRVKIAQEITRLSNRIIKIEATPLNECLEAQQFYNIRKESIINQELQIAG